jgi:hypothetical protein
MLSFDYELLTHHFELVALTTGDLGERDDGTLCVLIRRSKADPFGSGRIAFTTQKTARLLQAWIDLRGPDIVLRFCPIRQTKPLRPQQSSAASKMPQSALGLIQRTCRPSVVTQCGSVLPRTRSHGALIQLRSCRQEGGSRLTSSPGI